MCGESYRKISRKEGEEGKGGFHPPSSSWMGRKPQKTRETLGNCGHYGGGKIPEGERGNAIEVKKNLICNCEGEGQKARIAICQKGQVA